jgi:hypothetical protein
MGVANYNHQAKQTAILEAAPTTVGKWTRPEHRMSASGPRSVGAKTASSVKFVPVVQPADLKNRDNLASGVIGRRDFLYLEK